MDYEEQATYPRKRFWAVEWLFPLAWPFLILELILDGRDRANEVY